MESSVYRTGYMYIGFLSNKCQSPRSDSDNTSKRAYTGVKVADHSASHTDDQMLQP